MKCSAIDTSIPFKVRVAGASDLQFSEKICQAYWASAQERGTGIAKRDPTYISKKIEAGNAIIALTTNDGDLAGFCYIETWDHEAFVANSGLIVLPEFRKFGLARQIKEQAFALSRDRYPKAKLFGLTTSSAVMRINSDLGYRPVAFNQLTSDEKFWDGCRTCVNHSILVSKDFQNCLCTGMLLDPDEQRPKPPN